MDIAFVSIFAVEPGSYVSVTHLLFQVESRSEDIFSLHSVEY